jgi:hypothetical protein
MIISVDCDFYIRGLLSEPTIRCAQLTGHVSSRALGCSSESTSKMNDVCPSYRCDLLLMFFAEPDRSPVIGLVFVSETFFAICFGGSGNPLRDHGTQPRP